ncbi:unnamed protein product [Leptosia nina]|uniref:Uncharacterized protein n=1 Tax=Leptosia nina TaxID=320188 RepID=A0AAV1JTA2_9NEOP
MSSFTIDFLQKTEIGTVHVARTHRRSVDRVATPNATMHPSSCATHPTSQSNPNHQRLAILSHANGNTMRNCVLGAPSTLLRNALFMTIWQPYCA